MGFVSKMHIRNEREGGEADELVYLGGSGGMYGKQEQVGRKAKDWEGSKLLVCHHLLKVIHFANIF